MPAPARLLTEVFAPVVLATVLPVVVGVHAADDPLPGLGWGALAGLFCGLLPYTMIWIGVRRGRLTDRHIFVRQQRTGPFLRGLASVCVGLALLVLGGAPRELVVLVAASLAGGGIAVAVNHFWKASVHAGVAAGSVIVLALVFGPWALLGLAAVAAVGWSRVRLGDHTAGQVVAGAVFGAATAGIVFGTLS